MHDMACLPGAVVSLCYPCAVGSAYAYFVRSIPNDDKEFESKVLSCLGGRLEVTCMCIGATIMCTGLKHWTLPEEMAKNARVKHDIPEPECCTARWWENCGMCIFCQPCMVCQAVHQKVVDLEQLNKAVTAPTGGEVMLR